MVNSRQKGRRSVQRAIDYYTLQGYRLEKVEKTGRFVVEKDLFGLFDLLGIKKNQTIFIQVKTNKPATLQPYIDFAVMYAGTSFLIENFTWYDRSGFIVQKFTNDGLVAKEDWRKDEKDNK